MWIAFARLGMGMNGTPELAQIHLLESGCQNYWHWATIQTTRIEHLAGTGLSLGTKIELTTSIVLFVKLKNILALTLIQN